MAVVGGGERYFSEIKIKGMSLIHRTRSHHQP